ncbi:hypothetical protein GIB67_010232 [Kingdonia uniflora]|uniref:Centrosomin N-terminal motif 1 domain-containing protein n=1 Tax=Kingdonia uniflora TaxID=39325 RepID=A0A7J7NBC2_9MAGN|nr:hypothetical protein GIB67_010232 [Kingdonia uniflora]
MGFYGKRDLKPLILKLGVALALSFAGFFYSHLKTRRIRPTHSPPRPRSPFLGREENHSVGAKIISGDAENHEDEKVIEGNIVIDLSPRSKQSGDEEGFLLPEFNDLVLEEFDLPAEHKGVSPRKEREIPTTSERVADKEMEQEITSLRSMVRVLREREKNLEIQLLDYYGLKEQETAVVELQNRLKISSMEAKLLNLKIGSLQADNQRLEAQKADYTKLVVELELARAKINLMKRKIRSDTEQNKEQLLTLQRRVSNLQDHEPKALGKDADIQYKLPRLRELEDEMSDLKKTNSRLQHDIYDLATRLESTQPESEALQESNHHLRRDNDNLRKEIEQLQASRCADVEELVYLRWINACLRYELRNYQPRTDKIVARDLSRTLSPKSEEKAKQLILEYAKFEGLDDKDVSLMDFDSDYWAFSQDGTNLTKSCEFDESSIDISSGTRTSSSSKSKFFNKLKRLVVKGKDNDRSSADSYEEMVRTCSTSNFTGLETRNEDQSGKDASSSQSSSRPSLDMQKYWSLSLDDIRNFDITRRHSDLGSSYPSRRVVPGEGVDSSFREDKDSNAQKKLVKYAEALKGSSSSRNLNSHKRSVFYSSY